MGSRLPLLYIRPQKAYSALSYNSDLQSRRFIISCEFETNLVYKASSQVTWLTPRNPVLEKKKLKNKNKLLTRFHVID